MLEEVAGPATITTPFSWGQKAAVRASSRSREFQWSWWPGIALHPGLWQISKYVVAKCSGFCGNYRFNTTDRINSSALLPVPVLSSAHQDLSPTLVYLNSAFVSHLQLTPVLGWRPQFLAPFSWSFSSGTLMPWPFLGPALKVLTLSCKSTPLSPTPRHWINKQIS